MENKNWKAWLYLLPAIAFLGVFMVYPLADVLVYSFEEGYNSASQTFFGTGLYTTPHPRPFSARDCIITPMSSTIRTFSRR